MSSVSVNAKNGWLLQGKASALTALCIKHRCLLPWRAVELVMFSKIDVIARPWHLLLGNPSKRLPGSRGENAGASNVRRQSKAVTSLWPECYGPGTLQGFPLQGDALHRVAGGKDDWRQPHYGPAFVPRALPSFVQIRGPLFTLRYKRSIPSGAREYTRMVSASKLRTVR